MMMRQRLIRGRFPVTALVVALILSSGLFSCASVPEGKGKAALEYADRDAGKATDSGKIKAGKKVAEAAYEEDDGPARIVVRNDTPYPIESISDDRGPEYYFGEELGSGDSTIIFVAPGATTLTAKVSLPSGASYVPQAGDFDADGTYHWDISEGPWIPAAIETAYGYLDGYGYLTDYGYLSAYEYLNAYEYLMNY
jgi:hypothetical protein